MTAATDTGTAARGLIHTGDTPAASTAPPRPAPSAPATHASETFTDAARAAAWGPTAAINQVWTSGTTTKAVSPTSTSPVAARGRDFRSAGCSSRTRVSRAIGTGSTFATACAGTRPASTLPATVPRP